MSNMSIWLGPPSRLNKITDLAEPRAVGKLLSDSLPAPCKSRGHVIPLNSDTAPTRISSRRVVPSHNRLAWPRILSMANHLQGREAVDDEPIVKDRRGIGQRINIRENVIPNWRVKIQLQP